MDWLDPLHSMDWLSSGWQTLHTQPPSGRCHQSLLPQAVHDRVNCDLGESTLLSFVGGGGVSFSSNRLESSKAALSCSVVGRDVVASGKGVPTIRRIGRSLVLTNHPVFIALRTRQETVEAASPNTLASSV